MSVRSSTFLHGSMEDITFRHLMNPDGGGR